MAYKKREKKLSEVLQTRISISHKETLDRLVKSTGLSQYSTIRMGLERGIELLSNQEGK